ncbi:MAG: L-aspartate oxidase [Acidobacteriota bacterium]
MADPFEERRYLIPFRAILLPQIFTDVLVVGAGVAGLRAALAAAQGADVIVLAKAGLDTSNTAWAQGGIAAAVGDDDSVDAHVEDTLAAGAGLCEPDAVRSIVAEGPERIGELAQLGMPFDRSGDGALALGREAAHRTHRVLHAHGDATGRALADTLIAACRDHERIRLFEHCFALDLVTEEVDGGRCAGAITHHPKYGLQVIWARRTILAAGGLGQIFRETTNPPVATGDGLAMAWRAGAAVGDVEFVQFHPTTLYVAGSGRALISEAVRGEGAYLVDQDGRRFMLDVHELAELAPRDVVARAIHRLLATNPNAAVFLDARHLGRDRFRERFPGIFALLEQFGIDPGRDLIPIRPAAHYAIGGVLVDLHGRTSLPGLLACGEAALVGLHGANRLASNSLLEGLVMGRRAGQAALDGLDRSAPAPLRIVSDIRPSTRSALDVHDVASSVKSVLWRHAGIERDGARLAEVCEMLDFWARYTLDKIFDERLGWEVQNILWVGRLLVRAARWREESRGVHWRADRPAPDDAFAGHALWRRGENAPRVVPVGELTAFAADTARAARR